MIETQFRSEDSVEVQKGSNPILYETSLFPITLFKISSLPMRVSNDLFRCSYFVHRSRSFINSSVFSQSLSLYIVT